MYITTYLSLCSSFLFHVAKCISGLRLETGEHIIEIETYKTRNWGASIQGGFTLKTNEKTCGPYGKVTTQKLYFGGGRLLYMYGFCAYGVDMAGFVFDLCEIQ